MSNTYARFALSCLLLAAPLTLRADGIQASSSAATSAIRLSPTAASLSPTAGVVCPVPTHYNVLLSGTGTIAAEGGPGGQIVFLPSGPVLLSGGFGVLSLPYGFGLGVGAYALSSEYVPLHNGIKYDLGYTFGGAVAAWTLFPTSLFSVIGTVMVGPGQAWGVPRLDNAPRKYANFLEVQPAFEIMLNVTRELSIGVGGSWSISEGADLDTEVGSSLDGGGISVLILVGQI